MPSTNVKLLNLVALTALICSHVPGAFAGNPKTQPQTQSQTGSKTQSPTQPQTQHRSSAAASKGSSSDVADSEALSEKANQQTSDSRPNNEAEEDYSATVERLKAAHSMALNQALEHYDLARYYWSRWNLKMADLEYQAAIMYSPDLKVAHRDLCVLSMFTAHPSRCLAELMMVVGLGEPIPLTEEERVAFKKNAAKLHNQQGIAYGRKNRWDRAIAEFKWALTYSPANAAIERSLAFSYANKGDFEMAERSYTRSFSEDPADGYSHADFAFLLADNGGGDRALKQLSEAVKLEPQDPALHVDMGWMAESKGDLATAQTEFQQAVKLSPKHAGLWAHLGKVFEREGKAKDASNAYSEALALDPGQDEAKERLESLKTQSNSASTAPSHSESAKHES
ncbi:MAG TPA: tetratricopeptide repeat protein [Drouetiella sp.]|jgi:Flp pilus assembly protein TadD